jgi:hypothetical protein
MGVNLIKPTLFYTAALGAFLALMVVLWRKDFWTRLEWRMKRLAFWRKLEGQPPATATPITVPYGVAIAGGCLVALLLT